MTPYVKFLLGTKQTASSNLFPKGTFNFTWNSREYRDQKLLPCLFRQMSNYTGLFCNTNDSSHSLKIKSNINNNLYLSTYCVSGTTMTAPYVLTHLTFLRILW